MFHWSTPLVLIAELTSLWHAFPKWPAGRFSCLAAFTTLPLLYFFLCPTSVSILRRICVYIYPYLTAYRLYMNYVCYQITLQRNIFTQIGALRSVDWIFIVGALALRWLGECMTLGGTFLQSSFVTGGSSSPQLLPHLLPYRIPAGGLYWKYNNYTMH